MTQNASFLTESFSSKTLFIILDVLFYCTRIFYLLCCCLSSFCLYYKSFTKKKTYVFQLSTTLVMTHMARMFQCHSNGLAWALHQGTFVKPRFYCFRNFFFCILQKIQSDPLFMGTFFSLNHKKFKPNVIFIVTWKKIFTFYALKSVYTNVAQTIRVTDPFEKHKINLKYINHAIKVQPMAMPKGCVIYDCLTHNNPGVLVKRP